MNDFEYTRYQLLLVIKKFHKYDDEWLKNNMLFTYKILERRKKIDKILKRNDK